MSLLRFIISLVFIFIGLTGCSAFDFAKDRLNSTDALCSPASAYNQGLEDGRRGLAMHSDYASICPSNNIAINNAYLDGYMSGMSNRQ